jgi:hypothetical protein
MFVYRGCSAALYMRLSAEHCRLTLALHAINVVCEADILFITFVLAVLHVQSAKQALFVMLSFLSTCMNVASICALLRHIWQTANGAVSRASEAAPRRSSSRVLPWRTAAGARVAPGPPARLAGQLVSGVTAHATIREQFVRSGAAHAHDTHSVGFSDC